MERCRSRLKIFKVIPKNNLIHQLINKTNELVRLSECSHIHSAKILK